MKITNYVKIHTIKKWTYFILCMLLSMWLAGCGQTQTTQEEKLRDLEFTVVASAEQPETLQEVIEEKKAEGFQICYTKGDYLYLAIGYGTQQTGGYSISVNAVYETENTIVVDTTLIGPETQEAAEAVESYPYVVIKIENIDKTIQFL
ncbi:MAG: protease complex subunit PrcB family protein [Lachnospiraceae bacterium]|nr:protease complex subunit PrcB family protein [Lachnospiraceae bacterium]